MVILTTNSNIMHYSSHSNATIPFNAIMLIWELFLTRLEFFLNNTDLKFLAFLYKIDIMGFQNQQK